MTNPLIRLLAETVREETTMTDERTDRLEGYCDGVSSHPPQPGRSADYANAWLDARDEERQREKAHD